ncbi:4'-phosphopantetheinyl transferase superfamily protein [Kitasatospora sp. NPDC049285]|uniref:4'-phosphopantetheinyl transferase family protein n=1 Tax=Kitasatospora sp. NPDC049285 TaxID=3157096 RepID=UPI003412512B
MIGLILPGAVAWSESFGDPVDGGLFPPEERAAARMVPARRREFAAVRVCARQALGRLGVPPGPIVPGPRGEPGWPAGLVGSMTHCAGYQAAAVARATAVPVLGIDAEPHRPLPHGVYPTISLPQERARRQTLRTSHPEVHWDRLLFSVKESVFKAWYPLTRRPLDFEEADVVLQPDGTWRARIRTTEGAPGAALPRGFAGRWLVADGLLATVCSELLT